MRILVYPHDLGVGGSQLNAIEIGHQVSRMGHEVMIYGQPGPLTQRIDDLGLEFIASPDLGRRPSRAVTRDLSRLIIDRRIDIAHGYEWPPGLECHLACRNSPSARAVTTVMSMAVAPFLPHSVPLVVGTEQIAERERSRGRQQVSVIEPPVDIDLNRPGAAVGQAAFGNAWGLDDGLPTIVCVTRLARQLKLEGLLTAIDAIAAMHHALPARLLIVGDGDARPQIERRAELVNASLGYRAIVLTGELADPRPAYEVADVCLAMGGSALRSMAFAKPLIVQGEGGFFRVLTESSLPDFLWTGWYGHGADGDDPCDHLCELLQGLLSDSARRAFLGAFGRTVVEQRFSLPRAAERQLEIYESALQGPPTTKRQIADDFAAARRFADYHVHKRAAKLRGRGAADDFNAQPVARGGPRRADAPTAPGTLLYFAGVSWDAVTGTDRQLASALAQTRPVVWVDPPMSWLARRRRGISVAPLTLAAPGITRVNTSCPPGVSRPVLRHVARWLTTRHARRAVRPLDTPVSAVIVSSPEQAMPRWTGDAVKVYYETDDFVAGASLFGLDPRQAQRSRARNVARSDVVMGVTDVLTGQLEAGHAVAVTLPNGADIDAFDPTRDHQLASDVHLAHPIAGVVGQLNERLDLSLLEAVTDEGISLLLVGPRYDEEGPLKARLDDLIARPRVQWVDRQPYTRLPAYLATIDIGLTPYASTDFNRASFPLKTLEYLAAGLPVVSTDLPSARSLDTDLVTLVATPAEFAKATAYLLEQPFAADEVCRRLQFAAQHSWAARARQLATILDAGHKNPAQNGGRSS